MSTVPPVTPPPPGGGSYTPPPPPPSAGGAAPGSDRTLMVALSYLWILFLIPFLTKKDDAEVMWHAKNGMALTIVEFLAWVVYWIITWVAPSAIACAASVLSCVIFVAFLALRILCIVKGVNGQRFRIPVVTDLGEKM